MTIRTKPTITSAIACLAVVFACDALLQAWHPSLAAVGPIDEPAHLATAVLVLLALGFRRADWAVAFLVASVAIDVDHIPALLGAHGLSIGDSRPVTHSLTTPAVLAGIGVAAPGRWRAIALGAAAGVVVHLGRDIATGPGVQLFWPLTTTDVRLPYPLYAAAVATLALCVAFRRLPRHPAT